MTRFARYALPLLALTAATPAFAQDWRVAAISGAKPDRTVYLLDNAAIVRSGDSITFTTQSVFEQLTEGRDFDRSVTRRFGDCTTMASAIIQNSYYARGAFVSTDSTKGSTIAHREGTVMYGVLEKACGKKALEGNTLTNPESAVRAYFAK
ncbi:MAG: surface-adhesin E family protein [Pseudomonadota bacterium]